MSAARRDNGFSLIEVMLAILIVSIALVGLTNGITAGLASAKDSEIATKVSLLAAGQIEMLRADAILTDGVTEGDFGDDMPQYAWEQTIEPADVGGLHHVKVVVKDAKSGDPLYQLETMLFDTDYPASSDDDAKQKAQDRAKKHVRRRQ